MSLTLKMSYLLKIQVDDELLREVYSKKVSEHNKKVLTNHIQIPVLIFLCLVI